MLKFGTQTNLNMQNSMVMLTFFNFRLGVYFLGKFGPKMKIVTLCWNLVARII